MRRIDIIPSTSVSVYSCIEVLALKNCTVRAQTTHSVYLLCGREATAAGDTFPDDGHSLVVWRGQTDMTVVKLELAKYASIGCAVGSATSNCSM